jgi:lysophospholipase L1-like esterase
MRPGMKITWTVLVLLLFFVSVELTARKRSPQLPAWNGSDTPSVVMVGHPTRLWGLGAGIRDNAGKKANINADGLRGPMIVRPRPAKRQRILVLGDSSFFGFGLEDQETLDTKLVHAISATGVKVDAINGGVPGYSTEQVRVLLDEIGWSLDPTLLVVGTFWSDTNFAPHRDRDLLYSVDFADNPLARSAGYRWLATLIGSWMAPDGGRLVTWNANSPRPEATLRRVPIDAYAHNLQTIAVEAAKRGVGTIFVSPTAAVEVDPSLPGDPQWTAYREVQAGIARHLGIPWVDTRPALEADYKNPDTPNPFLDDIHPSALGTTRMAQAIARTLQDAGWPEKPLLAAPTGSYAVVPIDLYDGQQLPEAERVPSPFDNLFGTGMPSPADRQPVMMATLVGEAQSIDPNAIQIQLHDAAGSIATSTRIPGPGNFQLLAPASGAPWTIEAKQEGGMRARVLVVSGAPIIVSLE